MDRKLIEYLPEFMREFREMQVIMDVVQEQIALLHDTKDAVFNNNFIESLDEAGCERWERILNLNKGDFSIEERRNQILGRIVEQRPFTMQTLKRQLSAICGENGYAVELRKPFDLVVRLSMHQQGRLEAVETLLKRIVPANINIDLSLKYNTWGQIAGKTWAELSQYTWKQIKEDTSIVD